MARGGLEDWRDILQDSSIHIAVAQIVTLHYAEDRSFLKTKVRIFPEGRLIIARMSWEGVGPEAGIFMPPAPEDMVLVAMAEGDDDQAYVIRRLTSQIDKLPLNVSNGDTVVRALGGKKLHLNSDTKINLAKGDADGTENLVLGQIFKQFSSDLLTEIAAMLDNMKSETHLGALPGMPTGTPINAPQYDANKTNINTLKSSPIEDEAILSDISYTEKGS